MKKIGFTLILAFLLPIIWFYNGRMLKALPQYAAKEATRCGTCHFNPTGGMLRTETGINFAMNHHSFPENLEAEKPPLNFNLGEKLTLGSDMRFNYIYQDSFPSNFSSFFSMQGSIYLAAKLDPHLLLFYNNDFGYANFPVGPQNREIWGMFQRLPFNSYIKVGRFKVPYGIRLDDHTSFIKDRLGFGNRSQDNGVEIGFTPATFFWHLSLTNGAGDPAIAFDNNRFKAITSKAGFTIKNFGLGASFYYNRFVSAPQKFDRVRVGGFGSFSWRNLVLLSEVDWGRDDDLFSSARFERLALYSEAIYQIHQNIWLKAKWDLWDPETRIFSIGQNVKEDIIQRVTVGTDLFVYHLANLKLQYRFNLEEPDKSNDELLTQLYIFF